MDGLHTGITVLLIFTAYFIKGFSGFGPALILIPVLSLMLAPAEAVLMTTVFDLIAGTVLLVSVRKAVRWKQVALVLLAFFPGAYLGARFIPLLPVSIFKRLLAFLVLFFVGLIFWQSQYAARRARSTSRWPSQTLVSFLAGFGGGLAGISGPLLVIYFKLRYAKSVFRNFLIAVFAFGAAWRLLLYRSIGLTVRLAVWQWMLFVFTVLAAIALGSLVQIRIDEQKFDRIVALILLIPCFTLLFLK